MKISFGWLTFFYFGIVLLFALLYLLAWDRSPDSFIINQEFNVFPMSQLRELVNADQTTNTTSGLPESSTIYQSAEIQQKVAELVREKQVLVAEANELRPKLTRKRQTEKEIQNLSSAAWTKNTAAYRDKEFAAILAEGVRLTNAYLIAKSNADATTNAIERLPLVTVEANASMALADYRVRQANKAVEVYSNIVANIGSFNDESLGTQLRNTSDELNRIELMIETNSLALADFRGRVWDYSNSLRQQHIDRMGFVDFLYFSLGVSTTTTFGDIIPNSRSVRLMVIIQLIACIIIVGLFVAHLGDKILHKSEVVK